MKEGIISEKYFEWTAGLYGTQAMINVFNSIRDIPYVIINKFFDFEKGIEGMLQENRGFSISKHLLLGMMAEELGYGVRYNVYPFRWKDVDVSFPGNLAELAEDIPGTYHLACEVMENSTWVMVDATWDIGLKRAGFIVKENWDGKSDCSLAVKETEKISLKNIKEAEKCLTEKNVSYKFSERKKLFRFSVDLNQWLEQSRLL